MADFLKYWGSVFRFAYQCSRHWGRDHVIGLLLAIAVLVVQIKLGVIKPTEIDGNIWSVLLPYGILLAIFAAISLLRAPWLMHRKVESELSAIKQKLSQETITGFITKAKAIDFYSWERANRERQHAIPVRTAIIIETWLRNGTKKTEIECARLVTGTGIATEGVDTLVGTVLEPDVVSRNRESVYDLHGVKPEDVDLKEIGLFLVDQYGVTHLIYHQDGRPKVLA